MATKDLSGIDIASLPDASEFTFGVVVSEWNDEITGALEKGCLKVLKEKGAKKDNIHVVHVPGSFELPGGAVMLVKNKKLDAVICLGCVIKGETRHDEYINSAVSQGLVNLNIALNKPVIFGVLTTENLQQAKDRAGGKHGNKGAEAAATAIKMVSLQKELQKPSKGKLGF